jgi:capsid assembly protease
MTPTLHRFVDRPLALHPSSAAELVELIRMRLYDDDSDERDPRETGAGGGYQVSAGIALIPISGVLVHGPTMWWDECDYGTIGTAIMRAASDTQVRAIALQIESPGGEVSGLFDLADAIYEARGRKPVWSIVDDYAYSAAYAIASAADYVTVSRTGGVGSVGVVTLHLDVSRALNDAGLTVSLIQHGERKTDYSPVKPLSDGARQRLQDDIDEIGGIFDAMVARNRGISRSKVIAMQAATYMGAEGVGQGLADAVMSPTAAFQAMRQRYGRAG